MTLYLSFIASVFTYSAFSGSVLSCTSAAYICFFEKMENEEANPPVSASIRHNPPVSASARQKSWKINLTSFRTGTVPQGHRFRILNRRKPRQRSGLSLEFRLWGGEP